MKWCVVLGMVGALAGLASAAETSRVVVSSVEDLGALFKDAQDRFQPVSPPSEHVYIHKPGRVIPFDWSGFSSGFAKRMVPVMDGDYPTYTVLLYEDPVTRETVFMNVYGAEIHRLAPEEGYDPYAFARARGSSDSLSRWIYDPAHTAVDFTLIPEVFEEDYNMDLQEAAEMELSAATLSVSSLAVATYSLGTTDPWLEIDVGSGGLVELTAGWPTGYGDDLEIFATSDLTEWWEVVFSGIDTSGAATNLVWSDAASSNTAHRAYRIESADADFDLDGISDAREMLVYDSDPTEEDSDFDGIDDAAEIGAAIPTDPSNPDTTAPVVVIASPVSNVVVIP